MFGLLNIAKPAGPTSHDIVDAVRRRVGQGIKVGHAGTLDPFADGVLVVCLGPATRLADYVQAQPKRYLAQITLGATSDTDDPTGTITPSSVTEWPNEQQVREVLGQFVGTIQQVPPAHSAVHVEGRRAYKLARANKTVELSARPVVVHSIELRSYAYPKLDVNVACGGGTYIRALARDIGRALGCGAYCSRLTRTAVGPFTLEQAVAPQDLDPARHLLSPLLALGNMPRVTVDPAACARLTRGQSMELAPSQLGEDAQAPAIPAELVAVDQQGNLVALGTLAKDRLTFRPTKVFAAG